MLTRYGKESEKCLVCPKKARLLYCSRRCKMVYYSRTDWHARRRDKERARRQQLLQDLGGKCRRCGIDDWRVLEVNHKDRALKVSPPGRRWTNSRRYKEMRANMANLEVLCANCHRLLTWERNDWGPLHLKGKKAKDGIVRSPRSRFIRRRTDKKPLHATTTDEVTIP